MNEESYEVFRHGDTLNFRIQTTDPEPFRTSPPQCWSTSLKISHNKRSVESKEPISNRHKREEGCYDIIWIYKDVPLSPGIWQFHFEAMLLHWHEHPNQPELEMRCPEFKIVLDFPISTCCFPICIFYSSSCGPKQSSNQNQNQNQNHLSSYCYRIVNCLALFDTSSWKPFAKILYLLALFRLARSEVSNPMAVTGLEEGPERLQSV